MEFGYTIGSKVVKSTVGVVAQPGLECLPVTQEVAGSNPVNPVSIVAFPHGVLRFCFLGEGALETGSKRPLTVLCSVKPYGTVLCVLCVSLAEEPYSATDPSDASEGEFRDE